MVKIKKKEKIDSASTPRGPPVPAAFLFVGEKINLNVGGGGGGNIEMHYIYSWFDSICAQLPSKYRDPYYQGRIHKSGWGGQRPFCPPPLNPE